MKFAHKFLNQYKHSGRPWLIYRTDRKGKHAHLEKSEHIGFMKHCLINNILPYDKDWKIEQSLILSAKKLLTEKEFSKLKEVRN